MAAKSYLGEVEIIGLKEFRKELKELDKSWPKELRKANNKAAQVVVDATKSAAAGGNKMQQAAIPTMRALSTQLAAQMAIGNNRQAPFAIPAFLGSRKRTGWYAQEKYDGSSGRQFLPWVGNQWDVGDSLDGPASGEPYIVGAAFRSAKVPFMDAYTEAVDEVYSKAFPD